MTERGRENNNSRHFYKIPENFEKFDRSFRSQIKILFLVGEPMKTNAKSKLLFAQLEISNKD